MPSLGRCLLSSCFRGGTIHIGVFISCFQEEKGESECPSCTCCVLCLEFKVINVPSGLFWDDHILAPLLHRENNSLLIHKCVPFVLHLCYVGLTARLVGLWSVIYSHKTQGGCIYRPSTASLSWDPSHTNHPDPGVHPSPNLPSILILYMAYLTTQGDSW